MSVAERKEAVNAIYIGTPLRAHPDLEVYLDDLLREYEARKQDGYKADRYRRDQQVVVSQVDLSKGWYLCFITFSEGEARSIRTTINHGEYGIGLRAVYWFPENANRGANPDHRPHLVYVKRVSE